MIHLKCGEVGIVGFGRYGYTYASGRSGEWFKVGFAPRKKNISIYIMSYLDKYESILVRLGKYSTGKACLYINSLTDIDENVLLELIQQSLLGLMGDDNS